jgi:aspartate/glutamate racemase
MNRGMDRTALFLQSLLSKYEVDSFIVGCSEIHMLAKHFMLTGENKKAYTCVDPFQIIAEKLPGDVL